ncbi:MAG: efflux RND transporter periplasmic adaptor subunit [Planctomycetes bacterium]|nr:efflux RND transporter periplasmic adaptor subunit [Planctomycetota bacterium]
MTKPRTKLVVVLAAVAVGLVVGLSTAGRAAAQPGANRAQSEGAPSGTIHVESVLVTLDAQAEVPAREAGVLTTMGVREGDLVEEDQVLAVIDDAEAQLDKRRAQIELDIARLKSENDIIVRFAKAAAEVAKADYRRTLESREKFPKAVSDSELDHDRLTAEKAVLEIEQAEHEFQTEGMTAQLKENEYAKAVRGVERRKITSPISGVVVQVNRRRGEWVEPGNPVFRILRIDRLRAEGFLKAEQASRKLAGRRVVLKVDLPNQPGAEFEGRLVFVSPEIDPVGGQLRFWAEIENRDIELSPGMQGSLTIHDAPARLAERETKAASTSQPDDTP